MRLHIFLLKTFLALSLTACGTLNHIESDINNLDKVVDRNCIPNGILNVESLKAERLPQDIKVNYSCRNSGERESFRYFYKNQEVYVHACYSGDRLIDIHQQFDAKGIPRKATSAAIESTMDLVETSIANTCGFKVNKNN